ncbi:MAG TPA: FemAB family PEP-CTERM system-associated protein [Desulfocapsa sulfexigens]|nr:FemAB family PEP-CTERM system-associated protein [Desulfocapsa sulfexigens]
MGVSMHIRLATPQDKLEWDSYVDTNSDVSPYCRFAWKEAVEQAYGHKAYYLLAEEEKKIIGILPLCLFDIPFSGKSLVSLPFCDIGDVSTDNDDIQKALLAEAILLAKKFNAKEVDIRSSQKNLMGNGISNWYTSVQTGKVRMLLTIPGSSEKLWAGFKSKLRSQVRKAEKNGLIFRWGKLEDLNTFYQVFSHNMHALGSPVHSKQWIESILTYYGKNTKMGLVFKDDQAVGCGIILFSKRRVSVPWASTLREFNRLSPNMMLYWNFLKYAADNDKNIFDFGRSTPNEGTYRFKKQWGAEPEQLYWYRLSAGQLTEGSSEPGNNRKYLEQIWQKMPLEVVNFIGPRVRKYISL